VGVIFGPLRRRKQGKGAESPPPPSLGEPKGRLALSNVFQLVTRSRPPMFLVITGLVVEGELARGDTLKLPDGRLLRVESVEKARERKRVDRAMAGDTVGVAVVGVGWKPRKGDLERYSISKQLEEIRRRAEEKYQSLPKEAASKLAEKEVVDTLRNSKEDIPLIEIYPPTP